MYLALPMLGVLAFEDERTLADPYPPHYYRIRY